MILYTNKLTDMTVGIHTKRNNCPVSDTIYTFDIETTSLFLYDDWKIDNEGIHYAGRWDVFDYSKPKEFYRDIPKIAVPYIWQFGIENEVYYGRDFKDFEEVLKKISDPNLRKVIWVWNLSYEFGFLPNILKNYTIEKMLARDIRKPISFHIVELNITFACAYMLTNLSLETAAKEFTNIKKLDTLDYDAKVRLPCSDLTDEEMLYCEYDIKCTYEVMKYYRDKYKSVMRIPSTSTGELRRELQHYVGYYYIKHMWDLVPNPNMYLKLMACFQGGYTHPNVLNAGRIFRKSEGYDIPGYDIASSYPYVMTNKPVPCSEFLRISEQHYQKIKDNEHYCFIFKIRMTGVSSNYYNHYISSSRCSKLQGCIYDNGRVQGAQLLETWCTHLDLEIILKNYSYDSIEYLEIYKARWRLFDEKIIRYILELYGRKTSFKNVPGKEEMYKKAKIINALYGCSVTNPLKNSTEYKDGEWFKKNFTMDFVREVLDEAKTSYSTLFYYAQGIFITSWARYCLYNRLLYSHEFDRHVIYCDTDSVKYYGDFDYIFEEYNKSVIEGYNKVCEEYPDLTPDMFMPLDKKGIPHPIGVFEKEVESYDEFITLGAKKYAYREKGELHITVSGVSKKGVTALNDNIENFKPGFEFDYYNAHKLQHTYYDDSEEYDLVDYQGKKYHYDLKYGIVLQPTTYTLGITDEYESLINEFRENEKRKEYKKRYEQ